MKRSCPSCGPEPGGEEKKGRGNLISVQLFPPELVSPPQGGIKDKGQGARPLRGPGDPCFLPPAPQVEHIISFLPVRDVVALGQTCHYFHEVCDAEGVWRRICRRLSPRLREQGSGVRPWKRAAILNCTLPQKLPCSLPLSYLILGSLLLQRVASAFPAKFPGPLSLEEPIGFKHAPSVGFKHAPSGTASL